MSAGNAATRAARRPVNVLMLVATAVGLFFGLTAPDVSPVVGPALGATATTAVFLNNDGPVDDDAGDDDDDDDGDGRGGGGGGPQ